jgi:hypothetical protein
MARISRQELEDIIARDMPGYRLAKQTGSTPDVPQRRDAAVGHTDATTPSLHRLRQKYLFSKYGAFDAAPTESDTVRSEDAQEGDDEDEIVAVEPINAPHPWDVGARPKVIVVSGREKRIIGRQG